MWGGVLALALFGAAIGVAQWVERGGGDAREPDGLRLGEDGLPLGDRLDERTGAELPEGFVPDLPAVPTLPPGAHRDVMATEASTDDERLDALAVEMRLVREARGLIESDPAAALQLLDRHRSRYPSGALREEREAYAIEALLALRHTEEVERRYLEFREDFPTSSFMPRLERAMQ
jgi:hypothetical protein